MPKTFEEKKDGLKALLKSATAELLSQKEVNSDFFTPEFISEYDTLIRAIKSNRTKINIDVQTYVIRIIEGMLHLPVDSLVSFAVKPKSSWTYIRYCVVRAHGNTNGHHYPFGIPLIYNGMRNGQFYYFDTNTKELTIQDTLDSHMSSVTPLTPLEIDEFIDSMDNKQLETFSSTMGVVFT